MKNSIQFKHFRKFEDFPRLDFNDITFIVGKNNSGKSTFVKALVMVFNYLKSGKLKQLDLNQGSVELLNIVTFDRALCKTMPDRASKEFIPITIKLGNYEFFIEVTGSKDSTLLDVSKFKVIDSASYFTLEVSPQNNHVVISYNHKAIVENADLSVALQQLADLEKSLATMNDELSKESIDLKNNIEKVSKNIVKIKSAKAQIETSFIIEEDYEAENFSELFKEVYDKLLVRFWIEHPNLDIVDTESVDYDNIEQIDKVENDSKLLEDIDSVEDEQFDDLMYFYYNRSAFEKFGQNYLSFIQSSEIFYLPATLNKQSALLSIRDKSNDLAEVVHKYYQLEINQNPIFSEFVKYWINEFQIGTDLKIELINGEAYNIELKENDVWIPLADKGMGSIQAVLLILRLASVIFLKEQKKQKSPFDFFVIIEEPELNLHPALQSKLCELFFNVYEKYQVKFIIETHSEYVIRKTQLLVKDKELEIAPNENPFSVLYFNDDLIAWNMNYRGDGRFSNEFGSGFFDESSNLAFELM